MESAASRVIEGEGHSVEEFDFPFLCRMFGFAFWRYGVWACLSVQLKLTKSSYNFTHDVTN
jgi:hypothetical protein